MKIIQITSVAIGTGYQINGLDSNGKLYAWGEVFEKVAPPVEGSEMGGGGGSSLIKKVGWVLMQDQINNPD